MSNSLVAVTQFMTNHSLKCAFINDLQLDGTDNLLPLWEELFTDFPEVSLLFFTGRLVKKGYITDEQTKKQVHGLFEILTKTKLLTKTVFIVPDGHKVGVKAGDIRVWRRPLQFIPSGRVSFGYDWGMKLSPKVVVEEVREEQIASLKEEVQKAMLKDQEEKLHYRPSISVDLDFSDNDIYFVCGTQESYVNKDQRLVLLPSFKEYQHRGFPDGYKWITLYGQYTSEETIHSNNPDDWSVICTWPHGTLRKIL